MIRLLRHFGNTKTKLKTPSEPIYSKDFKFTSVGGFLYSKENTPRKIFEYLDNHVIGQEESKRALAIAYRNRWRRKQLPSEYQDEVYPKNILMVGPTGCGKTELARRLSKMSDSPFVKVEATQFTEVGYHGKDVDNIINELTGVTVRKFRDKMTNQSNDLAEEMGELINLFILDFLVGVDNLDESERVYKLQKLKEGFYDDFKVNIELPQDFDELRFESVEEYLEAITKLQPPFEDYVDRQTVTVSKARQILLDFYLLRMHFRIDLKKSAIKKIESEGIVIIDEIDKIVHSHNASSSSSGRSPSTEGVQRDLLPLIEGTVINTKFGDINTSHILFVCSGAFSNSKPSDLMPELLGRLPIKIDLKALNKEDFAKILRNVEYNLLDQYKQLLETEGIELNFDDSAIDYLATLAEEINLSTENIGARRLHSLLEKVVEEISYEGPDNTQKVYNIDKDYIDYRLKDYAQRNDYTKYML